MKIVVFNLGCKVNQYECDVIREKLTFDGHDVSEDMTFADAYILNTCAVTSEAERKSRQAVARCLKQNPKAKIFVMGCASQKSPESFEKEGVTFISGTANKLSVSSHINDSLFSKEVDILPLKYDEMTLSDAPRTRAFVKIQDGCNHFCSYCIIPYLRGRSRSREVEKVVDEITILSKKTNEIVLTGIDLMDYGKDLGISLVDLFRKIKDVNARIRLGSIYAEKITTEFLDAVFAIKNFCPHFHLSLQSGDDTVLKNMNRHYTSSDYLDKINLIRKYDANAGITTDIIVGYPTETNKAFENGCDFIKEAKFSDLHIFPFSPRTGTPAAKLPVIPSNEMKERKNRMAEIKKELKNSFIRQNLGVEQEVLIEENIDGYNVGYSKNYIKTYTKQSGEIVKVLPNELTEDGLKEV